MVQHVPHLRAGLTAGGRAGACCASRSRLRGSGWFSSGSGLGPASCGADWDRLIRPRPPSRTWSWMEGYPGRLLDRRTASQMWPAAAPRRLQTNRFNTTTHLLEQNTTHFLRFLFRDTLLSFLWTMMGFFGFHCFLLVNKTNSGFLLRLQGQTSQGLPSELWPVGHLTAHLLRSRSLFCWARLRAVWTSLNHLLKLNRFSVGQQWSKNKLYLK